MPTSELAFLFQVDYAKLTPQQREQFKAAVRQFVEDLKRRQGFRKSLRVKGVRRRKGTFEMTWAPNGRATFEYGTSPHIGDVHIIWRRIGGHQILQNP